MKKLGSIILVSLFLSNVYGQAVFNLQQCRELAIKNNKQIQIGKDKMAKAGHDKKGAFAQYFPDISFTGAYLRNQKDLSLLDADRFLPIGTLMPDGSFGFTPEQVKGTTLPNGQWAPVDANGAPFDPKEHPEKLQWNEYTTIPKSEFEMDVKNVWVGNFSLVQPIFMGGRIIAYHQMAKYAEELAKTMNDSELRDVIIKTDETYWQIISLSHKKKLTDSYLNLLIKMDNDVRDLIEEGLATKADGLSVKVKRNEAEMMQTQVENGLRLTKMLLCQLCGLTIGREIMLEDEFAETLPVDQQVIDIDLLEAFENRPELKSLNLAGKIMEKKEAVARAEMMPTVALTANYLITNPTMFNGFKNDFAGMWNVGVAVQVPLFHFGARNSKLNAAKTETHIKQLELADTKEKIELQINQSSFQLNEAEKKVASADKNMENAEENLQYATYGFEEGVIPASNLMEAQSAWLKANSEKIDAIIELKLSRIYLEKAIGKGEWTK